jgi:hypothetical protein
MLAIAIFTSNLAGLASETDSLSNKGISISYWGNVVNTNGIQVGLEKYMLQTGKYKVIFSTAVNYQRYAGNYSAAGITFGSSLRRTYKCGLFLEHGIKAGYLGSYYDFDFYKVNSDDEIVNIGRKWNSSVVLGYAFGFGYDFNKLTRYNVQLYVKPNFYYRFPNFNNVFYFNNVGIDAGFVIHPKWLK